MDPSLSWEIKQQIVFQLLKEERTYSEYKWTELSLSVFIQFSDMRGTWDDQRLSGKK